MGEEKRGAQAGGLRPQGGGGRGSEEDLDAGAGEEGLEGGVAEVVGAVAVLVGGVGLHDVGLEAAGEGEEDVFGEGVVVFEGDVPEEVVVHVDLAAAAVVDEVDVGVDDDVAETGLEDDVPVVPVDDVEVEVEAEGDGGDIAVEVGGAGDLVAVGLVVGGPGGRAEAEADAPGEGDPFAVGDFGADAVLEEVEVAAAWEEVGGLGGEFAFVIGKDASGGGEREGEEKREGGEKEFFHGLDLWMGLCV